MSVKTGELEYFLNNLLVVSEFNDFGPNVLQVEGRTVLAFGFKYFVN